jgi:hypothetical protein
VYEPKLIKEFRRGLGMYWILLYIFITQCEKVVHMLLVWILEF